MICVWPHAVQVIINVCLKTRVFINIHKIRIISYECLEDVVMKQKVKPADEIPLSLAACDAL